MRLRHCPRNDALPGLLLLSRNKSRNRVRIDETLELVRLDDKADRTISGFSGGELQRLGIGLVLVLVNQLPDIKPSAINVKPE